MFSFLVMLVQIAVLIARTIPSVDEDNLESTFTAIDYATVGFFTLENIIRLIICPSKLKFIKSPLNLIVNKHLKLYF